MIFDENRVQAFALAEQRFAQRSLLKPRSFLSIDDLNESEMKELIRRGLLMKKANAAVSSAAQNLSLALLFQKTSTRTRCSFEGAARDLGMSASYIDWRSSNFMLAAVRDEIIVLSRYYDLIVARVLENSMLQTMAAHSEVPVINALCDREHPCQALADFMTLAEYFGPGLDGLRLTYIDDGNNVCRSLALGSAKLGIRLTLCAPPSHRLDEKSMAGAHYVAEPQDAVREADVIYTDTWISIGQEGEAHQRLAIFAPYQVNAGLMEAAPPHALFMHCMPAHPGQEVVAEILRSPRSLVFDQAENRMHAQKALLAWLIEQNQLRTCRNEAVLECNRMGRLS